MNQDAVKRDFIEACYGRPVARRPIWVMRQAGRYQKSYRAVRARHSFEEVCTTPELACKVTLQPIQEFDLDAAILFSDILTIFPPMGLPVSFEDGGPKIAEPIRRPDQVDRVFRLDPEEGVGFVLEAIKMIRRALPERVPLIGFAGAPFTLACYAIEGATSREFAIARRFLYREPEAAERLLARLADAVGDYLAAQIDAGADAVQIFDSWGGLLSEREYRKRVLPHMKAIVARLKRPGVPVIVFLNGSSHLVSAMADTGCDVIGVDWRTDLQMAAFKSGSTTAIQGNLDPLALYADKSEIRDQARDIMKEMDSIPKGHIFNLGHGILPTTPEENLMTLVETVHSTPPAR
ncbi:MAG: uroporphyrinogen decarboxylase [Candidatus Zixiibacteriota bacterium]